MHETIEGHSRPRPRPARETNKGHPRLRERREIMVCAFRYSNLACNGDVVGLLMLTTRHVGGSKLVSLFLHVFMIMVFFRTMQFLFELVDV
jgi:hypothetical protein